jgi:3-isopropylmalate dehydrogenase
MSKPSNLVQVAVVGGEGIANPLGSILSVAMMLRLTLNRPDDADLLEKAVQTALGGSARMADIAEAGTRRPKWAMQC